MSRRSTACLLFVLAIWLLQKIWQRLNGREMMSRFVDQYLLQEKESSAGFAGQLGGQRARSQRTKFFVMQNGGKRWQSKISINNSLLAGSVSANRQDQAPGFKSLINNSAKHSRSFIYHNTSDPLTSATSNTLVSHRLLQRKTRTLRQPSSQLTSSHLPSFNERKSRLMIMGSIEEEDFLASQSNHTQFDYEEEEDSTPPTSERPDEDELTSVSASSCFKKQKSSNAHLIEKSNDAYASDTNLKAQHYRTASNEQQGLLVRDEEEEVSSKEKQNKKDSSQGAADIDLIDQMLDFCYI